MNWNEICQKARDCVTEKQLSSEYSERLEYEIKEITKQGANALWEDYVNNNKRWDTNPSGLVIAWMLGLTPVDPVTSGIKHKVEYQTDFPDIDLDFIPQVRESVKKFAAEKYKHVCSVGNWITYKPKSALQDVARAYNRNVSETIQLTSNLPDEFDDLTLKDHDQYFENLKSPDSTIRADAHISINAYQAFYDYKEKNPELVELAFKLVGKIKAQGTHAGGIIIADRPIETIVPMSLINNNWTSQWTEGKKTQLSKFGLVKYDILGVKTIYYTWKAGEFIKQNRGVEIKWWPLDPSRETPVAGTEIHPDGTEYEIPLNDQASLEQCNEQRTDSVFQIETPIQKAIISKGKVRDFWDLVAYNALGRPGPMDCIPEYIANRDDPDKSWKIGQDPRIVKILDQTHGVICFQEDLAMMWRNLAGFTVPEAESARKIISKKWIEKLPQVEKKWKEGAKKTVGEEIANQWWDKMVTFGRYAFNKSHAVAYSLVTQRCLYLKAHYPTEWWAAVMIECNPKKLGLYMSAARLDGVKFGLIDVNSLTKTFSVNGYDVLPGLMSIKGIGEKAAEQFTSVQGPFNDIDEVVAKCGKSKGVMERLIKLGAFDKLHPNRRGLWQYYQYKYCSGVGELKKEINSQFMAPPMTDEEIQTKREEKIADFVKAFPKRKKIPKSISEWRPKAEKPPELNRDQVMGLYADYTPGERLQLEKDLLGYYWSSPLKLYKISGDYTIENAKKNNEDELAERSRCMEVVVESVAEKNSRKSGMKFYVLHVTDGIQTTDVTVWNDVYQATDPRMFMQGAGIRIYVDFNSERKNFKIKNDTQIIPLLLDGEQGQQFGEFKPESIKDDLIW